LAVKHANSALPASIAAANANAIINQPESPDGTSLVENPFDQTSRLFFSRPEDEDEMVKSTSLSSITSAAKVDDNDDGCIMMEMTNTEHTRVQRCVSIDPYLDAPLNPYPCPAHQTQNRKHKKIKIEGADASGHQTMFDGTISNKECSHNNNHNISLSDEEQNPSMNEN